jgi:hypothetical protein
MEHSKFCPTHGEIPLTLLCIHKDCKKPLCVKCIYDHCTFHENQKSFSKIKTAEQFRNETSNDLISCLKTLYFELENIAAEPYDAVLKKIHLMHESALKVVDDFFKSKEEEAIQKLKGSEKGPRISDSSEAKANLQSKIAELEELNNKVLYESTTYLAEISSREFANEVKAIQFEISKEDKSIGVWRDETFEQNLSKLLDASIYVGKKLIFTIPTEYKSPDIEVGNELPLSLKKTGTSSNVGICLGSPLVGGIHRFRVKIEKISGSWIGLGFHTNNTINLNQSNYSTAICACSDQSFYNIQVVQKVNISQGEAYNFEANFNTGEVTISSENGLFCQATGYQNKTLYPYFEFNGMHHISVLSYDHIL